MRAPIGWPAGLAVSMASAIAAAQNVSTPAAPPQPIRAAEEARTNGYAGELEQYLRQWLVEQYPARAQEAWNRDYSSVEKFLASVEPNRARWRRLLNPPDLTPSGALERRPHPPLAELDGEWLTLALGPLKAEGLLVIPKGAKAPCPLVIAQHGIGSWPERPFGLMDDGDAYHAYARALVEAGFAVLAPLNLRSEERRNRIERLCRLADTTLAGIELARMQRLLDAVLADPRIDPSRVGMWGVSLGGMATMFWMPLEPRIRAGVVCAWFNHRRNKMAVPDERYTCFLETKEEHAFLRGWLTEFTDADVASLICPRPLLVQHGKGDRIGWWPQVVEEFEAAKVHYQKLDIPDRIQIDLHEGQHEARVESGVSFLKHWLVDSPAAP